MCTRRLGQINSSCSAFCHGYLSDTPKYFFVKFVRFSFRNMDRRGQLQKLTIKSFSEGFASFVDLRLATKHPTSYGTGLINICKRVATMGEGPYIARLREKIAGRPQDVPYGVSWLTKRRYQKWTQLGRGTPGNYRVPFEHRRREA